MLNEVYDTVEAILEGFDRASHPVPRRGDRDVQGDPISSFGHALDEATKWGKFEARTTLGMVTTQRQPAVPVTQWPAGTCTKTAPGVPTEPCDLARLLQVLCTRSRRAELSDPPLAVTAVPTPDAN